jgi:hypothetical protein
MYSGLSSRGPGFESRPEHFFSFFRIQDWKVAMRLPWGGLTNLRKFICVIPSIRIKDSFQTVIAMKLCLDEKEYKWLEAAKCYELSLDSENSLLESSHVAEIWRRIGFCYGRASRQAKHSKDFQKLMGKAVTAYGNATRIYDS